MLESSIQQGSKANGRVKVGAKTRKLAPRDFAPESIKQSVLARRHQLLSFASDSRSAFLFVSRRVSFSSQPHRSSLGLPKLKLLCSIYCSLSYLNYASLILHLDCISATMAPRKEPSEMSAFERRRLDNIAANTAILTELSTTAQKIIPDKPKPSRATKSTKPRRSMPARETSGPVRTSSRLAGKSADDDSLKRKFEVETMAEAEKAKARKMRIADDLNLGDIVVNGKKWGSGFQGIKGIVRGAEPGVRTFTQENIKQTTNEGLKDLRLRMGRLKLYEAWEPNGEHPSSNSPRLSLMERRHQTYSTTDICAGLASHGRQAGRLCR